MNTFWLVLLILVSIIVALLGLWWFMRQRWNEQRSMDMVFMKLQIPRKESKEDKEKESERFSSTKDFKEVVGLMKHFFEAIYSVYETGIIQWVKGQDFMSLEIVAQHNLIEFYVVVPRDVSKLVEKQLTTFYPDMYIVMEPDYNIFTDGAHVKGCYFRPYKHYKYPFKTYQHLNSDPLNSITNVFSKLDEDEAAALQIMIRPRKDGWQKKGREVAKALITNKSTSLLNVFNPLSWIGALINIFFRGPPQEYVGFDAEQQRQTERTTPLTDEQ